MKSILEFYFPEDTELHNVSVHAVDLYLTLWDIDQTLRSFIKYGKKFESQDVALQAVRDKLHVILKERGCSLEMMS